MVGRLVSKMIMKRLILMTKSFYENNWETLAPKIVKCNKNRPTTCDDCEMNAACLYYYTGDDSEFEKEEE